jgi:hypothetical protein
MNGGEIHDNRCREYELGAGGGVFLYTASAFLLNSGKIHDNYADEEGGGVCVYKAVFTMHNGEIYGNEGFQGGGVYLDGAVFKKQAAFGSAVSGRIYGNTAPAGGRKARGMFTAYAKGKNVYDNGRGTDNDIDESTQMSTDNKNAYPWVSLPSL